MTLCSIGKKNLSSLFLETIILIFSFSYQKNLSSYFRMCLLKKKKKKKKNLDFPKRENLRAQTSDSCAKLEPTKLTMEILQQPPFPQVSHTSTTPLDRWRKRPSYVLESHLPDLYSRRCVSSELRIKFTSPKLCTT